jgi:mono/diheme cytochrome c family protein
MQRCGTSIMARHSLLRIQVMVGIATRVLVAGALVAGAATLLGSRQPAAAAEPPVVHVAPVMAPGVNKFPEICQVCHQATGLGIENVFPPLAGSEWLNGRPDIPIAIVLKGLQGEISVKGKTYAGAMMPWESVLNDDDLAATLTYARSQWGNKGTPVTAAMVKAVRARFAMRTTPWSAAELKGIK